jgi:tRNA threonylcarbamoyladenosine biosynthesis protein TsaE
MTELSSGAERTRLLGARLAHISSSGDIYCIDGDLGTGKTEFVRGFVDALILGCDVRSPTFSIVNIYQTSNFPIYHFDFYRIEDQREFRSIGLDEYLYGDGVCLIEWGSMLPSVLPDYTKHIRLTDNGESRRIIESDFLF